MCISFLVDLELYSFSMRLLVISLCLFLICSCSPSKEQDNTTFERYKVDTLMIDAGSEIIFLKENLGLSDLSMDKKKLFNFDLERLKLQIINLEEAKLEKEVVFEKEGPNGIGDWFIGFKVLDDSTLVLQGDNAFLLVGFDGKLKQKIRLDHLFYMQDDLLGKFTHTGFHLTQNKIYVNFTGFGAPSLKFLDYDYIEDTYKVKDIPGTDYLLSSAVITYLGKSSFTHFFGYSMIDFSGDLILHNRTYPQMAVLRMQSDSMELVNPISEFYTDVPKAEKIKEVHSEKESDEFKKELEKRMNFLVPIWDKESQKIYRWGYKLVSTLADGDEPKYENYLFVMDKDFNVVEEFLVPEIHFKPYRIFLADGSLYLYQNFEDELGFIRIMLLVQ